MAQPRRAPTKACPSAAAMQPAVRRRRGSPVAWSGGMAFYPRDVARRGTISVTLICGVMLFLVGAFFRTQVLRTQQWVQQSEQNRLREVPLPAPRGTIYDRNGLIIAENVVGYSVSVMSRSEDSLRATMRRLSGTIPLTSAEMEGAVRRFI